MQDRENEDARAGNFAVYDIDSARFHAGSAIVIEAAQAFDVPACAELACSYSGGQVHERAAALAHCLTEASKCLFVARLDGTVVGYGKADYFVPPPGASSTIAPEGYYLGGVVVVDAMRRRGVGEAITRARMKWAFERAPELWYFANARNRVSLEMHAKLGFVEVTRDFEYPGATFVGEIGVLCNANRKR